MQEKIEKELMDGNFNTRQTLLLKLQKENGTEEAWEEFVKHYQKFIYLICRRMDISHHDSEEIVQKVFVKLWQQLPEKDVLSFKHFRSWLCVVTKNEARDFLRKKIRRRGYEGKAGEEGVLKNYSQPDIEKIADEEWQTFIVAEAMGKVKQHFSKKIIDIFEALHKGASVRAVAEKFDLPPNTVSVYKKRVLSALCEEVKRLDKELK